MTNFYNKFIELCETKGISPTKVAREIGIGTPNVTYWKNGSLPKADTALKLADYFGVTVDYLLGTYTKEPGKRVPTDNPNDRYPYLLNKKLEGTITPEEAEELAALERLNKSGRTGKTQGFDPLSNVDRQILELGGFSALAEFTFLSEEDKAEALKDVRKFVEFTLSKYKQSDFPDDATPSK